MKTDDTVVTITENNVTYVIKNETEAYIRIPEWTGAKSSDIEIVTPTSPETSEYTLKVVAVQPVNNQVKQTFVSTDKIGTEVRLKCNGQVMNLDDAKLKISLEGGNVDLKFGDRIQIDNLYANGRSGNNEFIVVEQIQDTGIVKLIAAFDYSYFYPGGVSDWDYFDIAYIAAEQIDAFITDLKPEIQEILRVISDKDKVYTHYEYQSGETQDVISEIPQSGKSIFISKHFLEEHGISGNLLDTLFPASDRRYNCYIYDGSESYLEGGEYEGWLFMGGSFSVVVIEPSKSATFGLIDLPRPGEKNFICFRPVIQLDLSQVSWHLISSTSSSTPSNDEPVHVEVQYNNKRKILSQNSYVTLSCNQLAMKDNINIKFIKDQPALSPS